MFQLWLLFLLFLKAFLAHALTLSEPACSRWCPELMAWKVFFPLRHNLATVSFSKTYFTFTLCVLCFACMCVFYHVPAYALRRGHQFSWNWNYIYLWAAMWVLETAPGPLWEQPVFLTPENLSSTPFNVFKTSTSYVAQAGLYSQCSCLSLPSAGITGVECPDKGVLFLSFPNLFIFYYLFWNRVSS